MRSAATVLLILFSLAELSQGKVRSRMQASGPILTTSLHSLGQC